MEADQNQEVPEAAVQSHVEETEPLKSEEVNETPSAQDPPEPEKPAVDGSEAEMECTEQTPEVELEKENVCPETAKEPEKLPEQEEVVEEVAKEVAEKAVIVEKSAEEQAEVEKKPEIEAVEQQITEPAEPEKKAEDEQKAEPAASGPPAASETAANEPVKEAEKAEDKPTEAEPETSTEAQAVQAEDPKQETPPKEPALPLFFGWFLQPEVEEKIKCSTMDFLKILDTLEAFKKHTNEFTGEAEKEVDLEQYFQIKTPLHCTTQFCDYGKTEGAAEYAEQQVVKDSNDTSTELSVVGLIVTPRTFGARVSLTPEQLLLWPTGADKVGIPEADLPGVEALPAGSRAHVTLGCAADVEAVQTGIDLLEILIFLQGEEKPAAVEELELGTLSYLGQGRWYLEMREAVTCDATFSSFSEVQPPAEPGKKESGEKKKKIKCSIL